MNLRRYFKANLSDKIKLNYSKYISDSPDFNFAVGGHDENLISHAQVEILKQAGLKPNETILEIGSGTGRILIKLKEYLSASSTYVGIDIVGASNFKSVLKSMALYGRIACVGEIEGGSVDFMPAIVLLKRLQVLGSYAPGIEHMSKALELLESKKIRAVIDSVLPLDQASVAHLKMESQSNIQGRIVLKPN